MFEQLHCPLLLFGVQPVLALHACGRTTGVVVECGDGVTQTCAVFDGYSIRDAARRVDFGGADVTRFLQQSLRQCGVYLDETANGEREALRQMKHAAAMVAQQQPGNGGSDNNNNNIRKGNAQQSNSTTGAAAAGSATSSCDSGDATTCPDMPYRLPDGTDVVVPSAVRRRVGELVFDPSLFSCDVLSLQALARETIKRCDIGVRAALCESVHLTGGSTLTPHLPERFALELARLTPAACKVKVHAAAERQHAAWHGGNILAQMSTVQSLCVSRAQYQDEGEAVLRCKLFG